MHPNYIFFLVLGPMIETRMQWKALIAFGDASLASTIFHCLNFQQEMERDENPRPKLISPADITGKTKIYQTCFHKLIMTLE